VIAWFADFVHRSRERATRPTDVVVPSAGIAVRSADVAVRHADVVVPSTDVVARHADVVTWSVFSIARSDFCLERSRERSSQSVMSFGPAAADFDPSIQISVQYRDVAVVTLHKASSSGELCTQ
jgi:hypothetical protein